MCSAKPMIEFLGIRNGTPIIYNPSYCLAAMRSFLVSTCPLPLATKISLGSKKDEASKSGTQATDLVPTGVPLSTTCPASPKGDTLASLSPAKRGKEKVGKTKIEEVGPIKRQRRVISSSTTLVVDVLLEHADDPPAARGEDSLALDAGKCFDSILLTRPPSSNYFVLASSLDDRIKELEKQLAVAKVRAENAEKIVTDPLLLAEHVCKDTRVAEVFLSAVSRTPVEDDLMYTYGTWAFNGGWKAIIAWLFDASNHSIVREQKVVNTASEVLRKVLSPTLNSFSTSADTINQLLAMSPRPTLNHNLPTHHIPEQHVLKMKFALKSRRVGRENLEVKGRVVTLYSYNRIGFCRVLSGLPPALPLFQLKERGKEKVGKTKIEEVGPNQVTAPGHLIFNNSSGRRSCWTHATILRPLGGEDSLALDAACRRQGESDEMRHKEIIPLKRPSKQTGRQDQGAGESNLGGLPKSGLRNAEKIHHRILPLGRASVCKDTRVAEVFLSAGLSDAQSKMT
nr:segmentation polarity homeobox protein engrailed-like [Ipomoea batatas]